MLNQEQLDLLWVIEVACRRCIRAAKFFDVVSGKGDNVWAFTLNCYGGICVIHWCQVFGARSEPTHYSHLFDEGMLAKMTKDNAANKLRAALSMNKEQYRPFWKGVKDARDMYLVHNEFLARDRPAFPYTALMVNTCLVMRSVVREIVESESLPRLVRRNPHRRGQSRRIPQVVQRLRPGHDQGEDG
jgi:hypothetical protein